MKITILGGGGFLGRKIAATLAAEGTLDGRRIAELTLFDITAPPMLAAPFPVRCLAGDITALPDDAIPRGTSVVFHLAAVVSAAAEEDYDLGLRVNLQGALSVIQACRTLVRAGDAPPRVVFTSSVATFSGGQFAQLGDDTRQVPTNSYGAEKAAAELLLQDASRRGFLDVVNLRLPTITVRPGRPNKAASSFVSSILREPLLGLKTELPVADDFAVWIASPRRAVEWLLHAAAMDTRAMGVDRAINPPGITATMGEMLAALDDVMTGGSSFVQHVRDPAIEAIIGLWPARFEQTRARALGFASHEPMDEMIRAFINDDLAATRAERGI